MFFKRKQKDKMVKIAGSPFRQKRLIFTFDGKFEKNLASVLIVFLDVCQQPYGWMPSLDMLLSLRIRSKVK